MQTALRRALAPRSGNQRCYSDKDSYSFYQLLTTAGIIRYGIQQYCIYVPTKAPPARLVSTSGKIWPLCRMEVSYQRVVIISAGVAPLNKVYKGSRHTVASECNAIFVVYRHESYIEKSTYFIQTQRCNSSIMHFLFKQ